MSDTVRTRSYLVTALADNTSGAIAPQLLRDWLISAPLNVDVVELSGGAAVLNNGDLSTYTIGCTQMQFGFDLTPQYRHYVVTRHNSGSGFNNTYEVWTSDGTANGTYPTNAIKSLVVTNGGIILPPGSAPSSPVEGQMYYDSTAHHFYGWTGSSWKQLDN